MDYHKYMWTTWYNVYYYYISVDLAQHEIVHAKVGKAGINIIS